MNRQNALKRSVKYNSVSGFIRFTYFGADFMVRLSTYIPVVIFSVFLLFAPAAAHGQIAITEIQARLFNSKTGEFSGNVLAKGAPELGNVPSGDLASVSTFIIVKISAGSKGSIPANARVHLTAAESANQPFGAKSRKQLLLNEASKIGPADADGNTFVGFWLKQTGCRTITLTASLSGAGKTSAAKETLPFACYE